jgi:DNA-binding transcriptional MocR family regulator
MITDLTGTPPTWPPPARELFAGCLTAASKAPHLWQAPAPRGDDVLREELAPILGTSADLLTITAGIRAAALTYARTETRLAVERPTFPGVVRTMRAAGADVSLYDWADLPGTPADTAIWVTSPFRNPDGRSLSAAEQAVLVQLAAAGRRVIVNGAYGWFGDSPRLPGADHLGSFHKIAGHGARLAWVVSADFFDRATAELIGTPPSPVWQRAWGLFLRAGGAGMLIEQTVVPALEAAAAFHHRLSVPHSGAPHALLTVRPGTGEPTALAYLADRSFRLNPGSDFFAAGAVRASFAGADAAVGERFGDVVARSGLMAPAPVGAR